MKVLHLGIFLVVSTVFGCSSSNSISSKSKEVEVISVSYQERVSGVEGYGSTYHFNFEFKIPGNGAIPDSVFFKNNAGKILRNFELESFYAKVTVTPEDNRSTDTSVRISFKKNEDTTIRAVDSVTILDKVHMP